MTTKVNAIFHIYVCTHEKLDPFRKLNLRKTTKLLNRMQKKKFAVIKSSLL